jgi:16S rRNA processing protein RimM
VTEGASPALRIGRVLKPHGVRGGVRVELLTDFPDRFDAGQQVTVAGRTLTVARSQQLDGSLLITFAEIEDRERAAELRGAYITVPLKEARALPADHYYHFQLVGLKVVEAGSEDALGQVEEVLTYPANDVLRITGTRGERLLPMISSVVREVDLRAGKITVEPTGGETRA